MNEHNQEDIKTRAVLAYIWSVAALGMLAYTLYRWGDKMEILTLIIGTLGGGVLGAVAGVFFGGNTTKKPDPASTVTTSSDTTNVTVNPQP